MRKKVNLLLLIILVVSILALSLVACNSKKDASGAPEDIGVTEPSDSVIEETMNTDKNLMLRFVFTQYMSSVFSAIPMSEFRLSNIKYQIYYADTGVPFRNDLFDLTEDMIDSDCREYLSQPGRHQIKVSLRREGAEPIRGAFTLNLSEENQHVELVTITIDLDGGQAINFQSIDSTSGSKVSIKVPKGTKFATWSGFESTFLMKKVRKDAQNNDVNQIPNGLTYTKNGTDATFNEDSTDALVLDEDAEYKVVWKDALVTVSFANLRPENAKLKEGKTEDIIRNATVDQRVEMDIGVVKMPNANNINIYSGYIFVGWYTKNGDENNGVWGDKWLSTQTVGRKDFTLYAKWEKTDYTLKIFTMGAGFSDRITQLTAAQIANEGLMYVESSVYFDITTRQPNDITLTGFKYGVEYAKYYTVLQIKAGDETATVTVRVSDFYSDKSKVLQKAGDKFELKNLYVEVYDPENPQASTKTTRDIVLDKVSEDIKAYINWSMKSDVKTDTNDTLSDYYINYAFKDGITLKADGTLRIDTLADLSINELVVPAGIKWTDGKYHPITEIGNRAVMNAKSLVTLDLSQAENLTTLGERAFCYCQSLSTVILPTNNNIVEVGDQAFAKTYWEDHMKGNIIVIGTAIYKYIGADKASIDMRGYVGDGKELASNKTYSLSAGCFEDASLLEEITLPGNIDVIYNYAFKGLGALRKVSVPANSKLAYIGENAFYGCDDYLLGRVNDNLDADENAIIVGSVFYRLVTKDLTAYTVPGSYQVDEDDIIIKYIAPLAFTGCADLANIEFETEDAIKEIGKDAFIDTAWMQNQLDGYTVVNGILSTVFAQEHTSDKVNITIPYGAGGQPTVSVIAEYAFHTYSRYIETIDIRDNVQEIKDYAFIGASSLKSLIFTSAKLNAGKDAIVGIPNISNNSFAGSNGEFLRGVTLYFTEEVFNYFKTANCKETNPDWYDLYSLNPSAFKVEKVTDYYINPNIKKDRILNETIAALEDYPGDGIVAESNSGVNKYFSLSLADNKVTLYSRGNDGTFVEVGYYANQGNAGVKFMLKDGNSYQAGILPEGTYYVQFDLEGKSYGHFNDAHAFVINVHNAIFGNYEQNVTLDGDAEWAKGVDRKFWIETFDGENWVAGFKGDQEVGGYPAFYTSRSSLDLTKYRFAYYDYKNVKHTISFADDNVVTVSGFAPTINNTPTLTFTINFYDICYYELELTYKGVKSLYTNDENGVGIYQNESISIPLNGNPANYVRSSYVYFKGQDGRTQKVLLNFNSFSVVSINGKEADAFKTDELGLFSAHLTYSSSETNGVLEGDVVYAVVLEADNSAFSYEIKNELRKEARITRCTSTTADTIVLPNTCTIGEEEYTIVEIADSVFKDFVNLQTVYLPSTLERIGNSAFYGCTSLKEVFTATQTPYAPSILDETSFQILTEDVTEHGTVVVTGLVYSLLRVITVPETITWTETETVVLDEEKGISYVRNTTRIADIRFTDDLFNSFRGTINLFDNEYNRDYAAKHIQEFETVNNNETRVRTVKFYTAQDSVIIAANSRFALGEFTPYSNHDYDMNDFDADRTTIRALKPTELTMYGNTVTAQSFASGKLDGVEVLVVPEFLEWEIASEKVTINDGLANYSYQGKTKHVVAVEFADDLFASYSGILYLFDNEYNRSYATAHLSGRVVRWYDNDENSLEKLNVSTKPATADFFNTSEFVIAKVEATAEDSVTEVVSGLSESAAKQGTLIIPEKLVWVSENSKVVSAKTTYDYTRKVVRYSMLDFVADVFDDYTGTIYLFDNEYYRVFANAYLQGKNVVWYDNDENALTDEQKSYMAGADSFVFETLLSKEVLRQVKLLSLEEVTLDKDYGVFVLSDVNERYEKERNADTWYKSINKGIETEEVVNVKATAKDFVIYVPDTFYTHCTINNILAGEGNDYNNGILTIYRSGNKTLVSTLNHAPDSLEYISSMAFANCLSLENIAFSEASKLEFIGDSAFASDSALDKITLGSKLQMISNRVFENCKATIAITYLGTQAEWDNVAKGTDWAPTKDYTPIFNA